MKRNNKYAATAENCKQWLNHPNEFVRTHPTTWDIDWKKDNFDTNGNIVIPQ
jgi:hypothetical protein